MSHHQTWRKKLLAKAAVMRTYVTSSYTYVTSSYTYVTSSDLEEEALGKGSSNAFDLL
jgi:hypothetical protein